MKKFEELLKGPNPLKESIPLLWSDTIYSYLSIMSKKILQVSEESNAKQKVFDLVKEVYERGMTGR
jgi:hypothetical protein